MAAAIPQQVNASPNAGEQILTAGLNVGQMFAASYAANNTARTLGKINPTTILIGGAVAVAIVMIVVMGRKS